MSMSRRRPVPVTRLMSELDTPPAALIAAEDRHRLSAAMHELSPAARRALDLRLGLDGGKPKDAAAAAHAMGLTASDFRALEILALRALRIRLADADD